MRTLLVLIMVLAVTVPAMAKKPYVEPQTYSRGALDCTDAIAIQCGAVLSGDTSNGPTNVDYYSCVGWLESGPEAVYVIELDDCYILDVALSDMTSDLDVYLLSACDENECIAYGNTDFMTECLLPGTYYIVVDGYGGAMGPFTLTVNCEPCECPQPPCCPTEYHCYIVDFNEDAHGFQTQPCLGNPVWEWGIPEGIPGVACDDVVVTNVLGTNLLGNYPECGEIAYVGPFEVTEYCYCLELCHYYDTEGGYDGGYVVISTDEGATWTQVAPARGYDTVGSSYGAPCIAGLPIFSGHQNNTSFMRDCFDLSDYIGQTIWVGFAFGADSSIFYPGWYIKWIKLGSDEPSSPVEESSWGTIKARYR